MPLSELLTLFLLYFVIPLWLVAGFADWLCHRATDIAATSGVKESLLHLLMIAEIGLPLVAALFLEINALLLAVMTAAFLLHEATVLWDLRYTSPRRRIPPVEQMVHSFQELLPLMALSAVALLHWDQFSALFGFGGQGRYVLEWKREPLPAAYLAAVLGAGVTLVGLPFLEELWRCWRRRGTHAPTSKAVPMRAAPARGLDR